MRTSIWKRIPITALAGCVVAGLAAPAWGQGGGIHSLPRDGSKAVPLVADVSGKSGAEASDGPVLRRDGSKAVPLVADVSGKSDSNGSNVPALRRDGSKAEPFVADVGGQTAPVAPADGFDWSDAAIGAGLGAAAVLLATVATSAVRGRRRGVVGALRPGSRAASG